MKFEWDQGNSSKILRRFHLFEIEDFFKQDLFVFPDQIHSLNEERFIAVGQGPKNKPMFVCYTIRESKIRVISVDL